MEPEEGHRDIAGQIFSGSSFQPCHGLWVRPEGPHTPALVPGPARGHLAFPCETYAPISSPGRQDPLMLAPPPTLSPAPLPGPASPVSPSTTWSLPGRRRLPARTELPGGGVGPGSPDAMTVEPGDPPPRQPAFLACRHPPSPTAWSGQDGEVGAQEGGWEQLRTPTGTQLLPGEA